MDRSTRWSRTLFVWAALVAAVFSIPATSSADGLPGASVSVCQVTGSASAPNYAQVNVEIDKVAAYLNQFPGSFVGTCPAPASGGSGGGGGGTPIATVLVCQATGNASSPFAQISVAVDQVAAFLSQHPGSFQGACSATSGGPGGGGLPAASLTVCKVTAAAGVFSLAEVTVTVDQLGAFLNQNPGSFAGACPAGSGAGTGSGGSTGPNGTLVVCRVTGSVNAPSLAQVSVAVDQLAAYINRNPGTFVGGCPTAGDPNGNPGPVPTGFVTICKVTGNAATPFATLTIAAKELAAYLNQAGTIVTTPAGGCPTALPTGPGSGGSPPSEVPPGTTSTVVVNTTPNTVVTANGAGVSTSTTSDENGRAVIKVKPKRPGIIVVRGAGHRIVKKVGVAARQTGKKLTG